VPPGNKARKQDHTTANATPPKNLDVFPMPIRSYPHSAAATRHFRPVIQGFFDSAIVLPGKIQPVSLLTETLIS
jgi:hypothetical protein